MRNESYEAMKPIIAATIIELMDCGETTPEVTCEVVAENHPQQYAALGAVRVLALCREIHESSEPEQSARLQELFGTFNRQYYDGGLGDFTVLAVYDTRRFSGEVTSGWVDFPNRQIYILLTGPLLNGTGDCMTEYLLEHMAHAATATLGHKDKRWIGEMQRLRVLGAPVDHPRSSLKT